MRRIAFIFTIILLIGCDAVDCPLSSVKGCKYELAGADTLLTDTLTIVAKRSEKNDTTLLNRFIQGKKFVLPVSYNQPSDLLLFMFTDTLNVTRTDTVRIYKTDISHFESVDCSPTFFHQLDKIECTHHVIDSIVISKSIVNYDTISSHLQLYIKPGH